MSLREEVAFLSEEVADSKKVAKAQIDALKRVLMFVNEEYEKAEKNGDEKTMKALALVRRFIHNEGEGISARAGGPTEISTYGNGSWK